jgi:small-conductance mechanosensitive channel
MTCGYTDSVIDLLFDTETMTGRLVTSAAFVLGGVLIALGIGLLLSLRAETAYGRYYARKGSRYVVFVLILIALAIVWRPFAGQIGVVLGLFAAGVAFAMQELIGAFAGWFNVVSGRVYGVGDRIEIGAVRGDVIDITPLRTKVLEMGSSNQEHQGDESWVRGRQYTGRVVAISNKATFTQPVFNYSAMSGYIWEELTLPVPFSDDWGEAETIVLEEIRDASSSHGAREAIERMKRRYPVPRAEVEPRVFVRATDNWVELSARFVVPIRAARSVKDEVTRRILARFENAGIEVASETISATIET